MEMSFWCIPFEKPVVEEEKAEELLTATFKLKSSTNSFPLSSNILLTRKSDNEEWYKNFHPDKVTSVEIHKKHGRSKFKFILGYVAVFEKNSFSQDRRYDLVDSIVPRLYPITDDMFFTSFNRHALKQPHSIILMRDVGKETSAINIPIQGLQHSIFKGYHKSSEVFEGVTVQYEPCLQFINSPEPSAYITPGKMTFVFKYRK
jgi:hypothetical protein